MLLALSKVNARYRLLERFWGKTKIFQRKIFFGKMLLCFDSGRGEELVRNYIREQEH